MLIIFDLDDTLIATTKVTTPHLLQKVVDYLSDHGLIVDARKSFSSLAEISLFSSSTKAAVEEFFRQGAIPFSYLSACLKIVYEADVKELDVEVLPGAIELVEQLSQLSALALVSLGIQGRQLQKIHKAKLPISLFKKVIILENGDKGAVYRSLMEELGVQAEEVIVCGDKIDVDLIPAKKLGCITVQILTERTRFAKEKSLFVDFSISHLSEIRAILDLVLKKQSFTG